MLGINMSLLYMSQELRLKPLSQTTPNLFLKLLSLGIALPAIQVLKSETWGSPLPAPTPSPLYVTLTQDPASGIYLSPVHFSPSPTAGPHLTHSCSSGVTF